jgi:hypothetical protein
LKLTTLLKNALLTTLLCFTSLSANDYLGFNEGDNWNYNEELPESTIDAVSGNWRHYTNFGPIEDVWVWTSASHNAVYTWTSFSETEKLIDFNDPEGTVYNNALCGDDASITYKDDITVFKCNYNKSEHVFTFAPNRGIIKVTSDNVVSSDLTNATINGETFVYHEEVTKPYITPIKKNLALSAIASAKNSFYAQGEQSINDNNEASFWLSDKVYSSDSSAVTLDFKQDITLHSLEIKWLQGYQANIVEFKIFDENNNWIDIETIQEENGNYALDITASKLQILLHSSNDYYFGINELIVK